MAPASTRSGRRSRPGSRCSTATPTATTTGPSSPSRAIRGAGGRAGSRGRGGDRAIDMSAHRGLHPAIGALDVCPIVWLDPGERDAARAAAGDVAARIGALGVPVFLYGELATAPDRTERAYFRNGGLAELWLRMEGGELRPDQGPGASPSERRRDPRHRPAAAGRLQRRARQQRRRGREGGRRRAAGVGRRPGRRAGDRPRALLRTGPGLDQRPRPSGSPTGPGCRARPGAGGAARRHAPSKPS